MDNDQILMELDNSDIDDPSDEDIAINTDDSSESEEEQPINIAPRGKGIRTRGGRPPMIPRNTNRMVDSDLWNKTNIFIEPGMPEGSTPIPQHLKDPIKYFQSYIDSEILDQIVEMTNRRSVFISGKSLNLTRKELQKFLGIDLLMGTIKLPSVHMYWSDEYGIPIIKTAMPRDRFYSIRTQLKVVDDNEITADERKNDRIWKIRPLVNKIRSKCLTLDRPYDVCVDEQIIPFTGRTNLKNFTPGKPNPTGLKMFVLSNSTGLILDFFIYQGTTSFSANIQSLSLGLGPSCVLQLCENLNGEHSLYCDRYFTTVALIDHLRNTCNIFATGTMQKNRIPKCAVLKTDREMKKIGRGSIDELIHKDGHLSLVKWSDNKPVIMLSSIHKSTPTDTVKRWSKSTKTYIEVNRPKVISKYNANMGGVDLHNRMLSFYRMTARTGKWTIRAILHLMDLCVVNSWMEYKDNYSNSRKSVKLQKLHAFKQDIAKSLIDLGLETRLVETGEENMDDPDFEPEIQVTTPRRKLQVPLPPTPMRRDHGNHLPKAQKTTSRCRNSGCSKRSMFICSKCKIALCIKVNQNCFKEFHKPTDILQKVT